MNILNKLALIIEPIWWGPTEDRGPPFGQRHPFDNYPKQHMKYRLDSLKKAMIIYCRPYLSVDDIAAIISPYIFEEWKKLHSNLMAEGKTDKEAALLLEPAYGHIMDETFEKAEKIKKCLEK